MNNAAERGRSSVEDDIENIVFGDGELLKKVLDITLKERQLMKEEKEVKIVNFQHPHQLMKNISLSFSNDGCGTINEIENIIEQVVKFSVRTAHPHFYNQLYGALDEVSLAGAWLLEALNTNQHTFEVAPVFILIEHYVVDQLCKLFGWEEGEGDGIFAAGGSMSNMYGIALARHKRYPNIKEKGMFGLKELVLLTSDMSHYSLQKSASFMGFGTNQVIEVATDERGRMSADALRSSILKATQDGKEPLLVNATSGTTVLGAFDPLDEIADVCREYGLWMHVDACWGGSVILSDKYKYLLKGIERADSISWNPHKLLCAPLQCSAFLVRHKGLLSECNSAGASYLFQKDKFYDMSYDTGDKSIQCGRKADAFKLWIMFRVHGLDVYKKRINNAFEAARYLEDEIERRGGFRLVRESACTNVCFWYIPRSLRNENETQEWWEKLHKVAPAIKAKMVTCGSLLVGYQPLEKKNLVNFFRMIITGYPRSKKDDMDFVLDEIHRLGRDL